MTGTIFIVADLLATKDPSLISIFNGIAPLKFGEPVNSTLPGVLKKVFKFAAVPLKVLAKLVPPTVMPVPPKEPSRIEPDGADKVTVKLVLSGSAKTEELNTKLL